MASATSYHIKVTSPKLADRRASEWLRAEQMGDHVALFQGENLTTNDLVALDQDNVLDPYLEVLNVPKPARAEITAKCKTLQIEQAMARLDELIASTKDQFEVLDLANAQLSKDTKAIRLQINAHFEKLTGELFGRLTAHIIAETTRVKSKLVKMTNAKRAEIECRKAALNEQLTSARRAAYAAEALSQSAGGQLGQFAVLAAVRKVLDNEVNIDGIDPGALIFEINDHAVDQLAFDVKFADVRIVGRHREYAEDESKEAKSRDEKPQIMSDDKKEEKCQVTTRDRAQQLQAALDNEVENAQVRQKVADKRNLAEAVNAPSVRIAHGHCAVKNPSKTKRMQDTVVVAPKLRLAASKCTSELISLFAVFDGHGGTQCSAFCAEHLTDIITNALGEHDNGFKALRAAMAELNERASRATSDMSGSTACVVMIDHVTRDLWCCNVGDSRCILMNRACTRVEQLSVEHSPMQPSEKKRITNGGGWIQHKKVCGTLSVSRRIGDVTPFVNRAIASVMSHSGDVTSGNPKKRADCSEHMRRALAALVPATPDITHHKLVQGQDRFLVVASDGLLSDRIYSNEQCMEWIKPHRLSLGDVVQKLADGLVDSAIKFPKCSQDDVSAIVLKISA